VLEIDGHDFDRIESALKEAGEVTDRPSLVIARTVIAKGSACMEGSEESHGAPLGENEIMASKEKLGCDSGNSFCVPGEVYRIFEMVCIEKKKIYGAWNDNFNNKIQGELKDKWKRFFTAPDIESLREKLPVFETGSKLATRAASGKIIEALYRELPNFIGGSADLGPSNKTLIKGVSESGHGKLGRIIHYGVRENAMGSIQNGISYYGGFINFTATFFVFMDYMRPAVRLAALSGLQSIYVFTHDSIFVGEDGPTHQPVEHLAVSRAIPNLNVIRPCDAEETREAWLLALSRTDGPTMIVLSRQNLPVLDRTATSDVKNLSMGAYVIHDYGDLDLVILSSGSEVSIAVEASKKLFAEKNIRARVVSFPCWELFDKQDSGYRTKVLGENKADIVVEAGLKMGWEKYCCGEADYITVEGFGRSAPDTKLAEYFGLTSDRVAARILEYYKRKQK
jgi:transketolase